MPTLASHFEVDSAAADKTTLTTPSFTPATGDCIVLKGNSEDSTGTLGTPTATGSTITWTTTQTSATSNHTYNVVWRGVVTSGGVATTVSLPYTAGTGVRHSMVMEQWQNAKFATTPAIVTSGITGSGAPSATLITVAAGSVVSWVSGDWAAINGSSRVYRSSAVETGYRFVSGASTVYYAYQAAASAGSQTLGESTPTGQTWSLVGVEVQDNTPAGGGPVSGTVAGASSTSGAVQSRLTVAGTTPGVSAASAAPASLQGVTGAAAVVSAASGSPTALLPVSGAVAAVSATSGTVGLAPSAASGTVAGTSSASGSVTALLAAGGSSTGVSGASGTVVGIHPVAGTADAVSGATAAPTGLLSVTGTTPGSTSSAGTAIGLYPVSGSTAAVSGTSGTVGVISGGSLAASGSVSAVSGAASSVALRQNVTGTTSGTSGSAGASGALLTVGGTTPGVASVTGAAFGLLRAAGTAAGASGTSASVGYAYAVTGTTAVVSTVYGTVNAVAADTLRDLTLRATALAPRWSVTPSPARFTAVPVPPRWALTQEET